jgi:hypothetical protein
MPNGTPTILAIWSSISLEGIGEDPEDVGDVAVKFEVEGVSGVVGVVADEAAAVVENERTEDGDGVAEEEIGGRATFVRICWSA